MTQRMKPAELNAPDVIDFLELWGLSEPVVLEFQEVDPRYINDFCHISAKHRVIHHGGIRIHGWALWQFAETEENPSVVMGNFHSIWQDADLNLIDVTPPKCEFDKILFVADPNLTILNNGSEQYTYNNRTSWKEYPWLNINGRPTTEERMYFPNNRIDIVEYCHLLGLPDTDMR